MSNSYINARTSLLWECSEGHQWKAAPYNIKSGRWCPHCAGKSKGTIGKMQKIAEERGGKCLSETYVNARTPLLWECSEGHQWKTTSNSIKSGQWCSKCYNKRRGMSQRLNIEVMQEIAKQKNGKCLSDTYVNTHTKLLWECSEGHQWETRPSSVKRGSWCRECAYITRKVKKQ